MKLMRSVRQDIWSLSIPSSSSFSASVISLSFRAVIGVSALLSLLLSFLPGCLSQEFSLLLVNRRLISSSFLLLSTWLLGKSDFNNGKESFLLNLQEALLLGHEGINNLLLADWDDLVKTRDFSLDDLSDPECSVDESFCGLDGHEFFVLTKEKGESPGDVLSWVMLTVP